MQGLKVLDNSVENFASGAWQALGNAWKGGSNIVQKYVVIFIGDPIQLYSVFYSLMLKFYLYLFRFIHVNG